MKAGVPPRSFVALLLTQSLTVFNDNLFKQVVLLYAVAAQLGLHIDLDLQPLAGLAFSVPFVIFAATAGNLADRWRKRDLLLAAKWAELGVMIGATLAFLSGSFPWIVVVLFLMGAQSAFLGPAKYGALVEHFDGPELGRANGIMQATVLASIILGTGVAGKLWESFQHRLWIPGLLYCLVAALGIVVARGVHAQPPADPERPLGRNPWHPIRVGFAHAVQIPGLLAAILGHGLYWMLGGMLLYAWNEMGTRLLDVDASGWTIRLATLSLSTAGGCLAAGMLCRDRTGPLLPVLGGAGLALSFFLVAAGPRDADRIWLALLADSFCAGFYLIPLRTAIQRLPPSSEIGRTLGTSQMTDWLFIVAASLVKQACTWAGLDAVEVFWVLATLLTLALVPLALTLPRVDADPSAPSS